MSEVIEKVYVCYNCMYSITGYSKNGLLIFPEKCPSCDAEIDESAFSDLFEGEEMRDEDMA